MIDWFRTKWNKLRKKWTIPAMIRLNIHHFPVERHWLNLDQIKVKAFVINNGFQLNLLQMNNFQRKEKKSSHYLIYLLLPTSNSSSSKELSKKALLICCVCTISDWNSAGFNDITLSVSMHRITVWECLFAKRD